MCRHITLAPSDSRNGHLSVSRRSRRRRRNRSHLLPVAVAVIIGFATCPGTSRTTKITMTTTASAAAKSHRRVIKIITLCPRDAVADAAAAAAAGGNNEHTSCAFYGTECPSPTADRRLFPLFPFDIIVMIIVICFCGSDLQFVAIVLTRHRKTTTWHSLGT